MSRWRAPRLLGPALLALTILIPPAVGGAAEPASWPAAKAIPATNAPRLYVLAFSGAAIDDVAAAVLGTALGRPFDVDPALQGSMDLHVEERLTPDQLMGRFSQALAAAGGALVDQDGRLTLAPTAKARRMAQADQRARGAVRRFAQEGASAAVGTQDRFNVVGRSASPPPRAPAGGAPMLWMWLAALAGAGAALAAVGLRRRISVGPVPRPAGARAAVIDYLLAREAIGPEALADARRRADEIRQPLEQTLNQMGRVSDENLVAAYAAVTGCRIWRPADQPALTGSETFGPTPDYMRLRGLVPVALDPRRLTLAALDPLDDEAIAAAAAAAERPVRILIGAPADVRQALRAN